VTRLSASPEQALSASTPLTSLQQQHQPYDVARIRSLINAIVVIHFLSEPTSQTIYQNHRSNQQSKEGGGNLRKIKRTKEGLG